MKNEYKKDEDGIDTLVLNYDGSMSADITVEMGDICVYSHGYDHPNYNTIPIEDWEEFKAFVDNQIAMKGE